MDLRSKNVTQGVECAGTEVFYAMGYTKEELKDRSSALFRHTAK